MNIVSHPCDAKRIESFLCGEMDEAQIIRFESHLTDCEACRRSIEVQAATADCWQEAEQFLQTTVRAARHDSIDHGETPESPYGSHSIPIRGVLQTLTPTDNPRMLGRLGGYEVSGVIGAGGMGVVLKATDPSLDRTVAIKVMAPHLAASGAARKRFAREAKAAAAVLHPNVIAIHSVSTDDGLPYLVMPYNRGTSLQKRIDDQGALPLEEVLRISSQVAAGLAAAHGHGLVHRDIKPANILLEDGVERVAITDFGLARTVDDATITCSGVIAGTPQFMSPEQACGDSVRQSSDLFSLGSLMYAMCTARPPFRAETTYGVLKRIIEDKPTPINEVNPAIPGWLCQLIDRLMEKKTEDRFPSAAKVSELLEHCLAHVQQPTAVALPASLVVDSKPKLHSVFSSRALGAMVMTVFAACVMGMLLWLAPEPPDISGQWLDTQWGTIELNQQSSGKYLGSFVATNPPLSGKIELKWSRVQRRFNGTWTEGTGKAGKLFVESDRELLQGAWTTNRKSQPLANYPRIDRLTWRRSQPGHGETQSARALTNPPQNGPPQNGPPQNGPPQNGPPQNGLIGDWVVIPFDATPSDMPIGMRLKITASEIRLDTDLLEGLNNVVSYQWLGDGKIVIQQVADSGKVENHLGRFLVQGDKLWTAVNDQPGGQHPASAKYDPQQTGIEYATLQRRESVDGPFAALDSVPAQVAPPDSKLRIVGAVEIPPEEAKKALEEQDTTVVLWSSDENAPTIALQLTQVPLIRDADLESVQALPASPNLPEPSISIVLKPEAAKRFALATELLIHTSKQPRLAIFVDGQLRSAPHLRSSIQGGKATLTGSFTAAEVQQMVEWFNVRPPHQGGKGSSLPARATPSRTVDDEKAGDELLER